MEESLKWLMQHCVIDAMHIDLDILLSIAADFCIIFSGGWIVAIFCKLVTGFSFIVEWISYLLSQ